MGISKNKKYFYCLKIFFYFNILYSIELGEHIKLFLTCQFATMGTSVA